MQSPYHAVAEVGVAATGPRPAAGLRSPVGASAAAGAAGAQAVQQGGLPRWDRPAAAVPGGQQARAHRLLDPVS